MALATTAHALLRVEPLLHCVDRHAGHDRRAARESTETTTAAATTAPATAGVTLLLVAALRLRLSTHANAVAALHVLHGVEHSLGDAVVQR